MTTILLATLLAGLPQVVIADQPRERGDPTEIKISVTNKTEEMITVCFNGDRHRYWFEFGFFDEGGRPLTLTRTRRTKIYSGSSELIRIKPGKTVTGYLSPRLDYEIPPGHYQVALTYSHRPSGQEVQGECVSNQITKTFP